jgi:hypothetical protein
MPIRSIATITEGECDEMYKSKTKNEKGENIFTNPMTSLQLSEYDKTFKHIDMHCKNIDLQKIVQKWIKSPLLDPVTNKKIPLSLSENSEYASLYRLAYKFYTDRGITDDTMIKSILPYKHILFDGKIDLLFYSHNISADTIDQNIIDYYEHYEYIYKKIDNIVISKNKATSAKAAREYEKKIVSLIVKDYIDYLADYIRYIAYLQNVYFEEMSEYVHMISYTLFEAESLQKCVKDLAIYEMFIASFMNSNANNDIKAILKLDEYLYPSDLESADVIIPILKDKDDIIQALIDYLDEIYNTYNYEEFPDKSPFLNIGAKPFAEIDDPLVGVLHKIGIENLDLTTLEVPKRIFADDREYGTYITRYNNLKRKYKNQMKSWRTQQNTPQPDRPTLTLPNNSVINVVVNPFPHYVKDKKYNSIIKTLNDNKHILDMYKQLIDEGVLNLLQKADQSIPTNIDDDSFLKKDRKYFKDKVLYDDADDLNKNRCISNTDGISQDEFDDDKYMLAKLQLLFQLHTKNEVGNIVRTDCFYAPSFYNHIVQRLNNQLPINNPVTNVNLPDTEAEQAIEALMKIMSVIVPGIERPRFILPVYDSRYVILHNEYTYNNHQYYDIYTQKYVGNLYVCICHICTILADVEDSSETGSTNMTSSTFLQYIYKLFNKGVLMNTYVPPYYFGDVDNRYYIKAGIHFNRYYDAESWNKPRKEQIRLFKHYMEEILQYVH